MQAIWTAIIAVVGTLLGSAATYFFQRRSSERAESFSFQQQLRAERVTAYSDFIRDVTEYSRVSYEWCAGKNDSEDPEAAYPVEINQLWSNVYHTLSRIQLIANDPGLVSASVEAAHLTRDMRSAPTNQELRSRSVQANKALQEFIKIASHDAQINPVSF
jgi:hypothetical protein